VLSPVPPPRRTRDRGHPQQGWEKLSGRGHTPLELLGSSARLGGLVSRLLGEKSLDGVAGCVEAVFTLDRDPDLSRTA